MSVGGSLLKTARLREFAHPFEGADRNLMSQVKAYVTVLLITVGGCSEPVSTQSPPRILQEPESREQETILTKVDPRPAAGTSPNKEPVPAGVPPTISTTDASQDADSRTAKPQEDNSPPKRPEPGHAGKFLVADGRYLSREEISAENEKKRAAQTDKNKTSQQPDFAELPVYGATHLTGQYMANEVAADAGFTNARFIVSGEIVKIGNDIFGTPYLRLKGQDDWHAVRCSFRDDAAGQLANLNPGAFVSIYGVCMGSSLGEVLLVKCQLMSDHVNVHEGQILTWRRGKESIEADARAVVEAKNRKQEAEADQRKLEEDRKAREKAELARIEEAKYRTWTSGKYSVVAKVVSYANGLLGNHQDT